jgi:hypothetical protein
MCTGAGIEAMRSSRSVGGVETARVVGAWWLTGFTTWTAVPVFCAEVVGAWIASGFWYSSISVSLGTSGVEY